MIGLCKVVSMSRQNYYKQRNERQRRQVDEEFVLFLVRRERAVQPRLGTRKLLYLIRDEMHSAGVFVGRDRLLRFLARDHF